MCIYILIGLFSGPIVAKAYAIIKNLLISWFE